MINNTHIGVANGGVGTEMSVEGREVNEMCLLVFNGCCHKRVCVYLENYVCCAAV